MTSDPDIFRAAKLIIDQHGIDAGLWAAERADHLLEAGEMIGATTWRRILAAIEELRHGRREGEKQTKEDTAALGDWGRRSLSLALLRRGSSLPGAR